uniref:Chromosome condensation protein n=2 Tax=Kalmanozyma brasiliensis (strain GHG001) TaxID=1365824 RepID=V5GPP2_KALBG
MGLAIGANRQAIEGRYPPAYIMITTGLCGSITTFSKWMLDVFRAFGDQQHYNRGGLHNVMDAMSQTALTVGMALVSISAGIALSKVINLELLIRACFGNKKGPASAQAREVDEKKSLVHPGQTLVLDTSVFLLGLVFWIASAILCALYPPFRRVTFGLVLAPPGTILRWYLSRFNSHPLSKRTSLPLGTLAANLFATAVICAAFTASRAGSAPRSFAGGLTGCEALQGLEDGFCGCLSTVSTFAVELRTIKPRRKAVRYAVVSWVAGVLICVVLVGAPWWSGGMDGRCLGYTS